MPTHSYASVVHKVSEGNKFKHDTSLEVIECPTCHILHAIPETLADSARAHPGDADRGWKLTCPLGHTWWFLTTSNTPEFKLKRTQENLEYERQRAGRLAAQRDQARASLRSQKGATTKLKKRIAAGVCPVPGCGRHFQNLQRHIAGQHPEFPIDQETTTS